MLNFNVSRDAILKYVSLWSGEARTGQTIVIQKKHRVTTDRNLSNSPLYGYVQRTSIIILAIW